MKVLFDPQIFSSQRVGGISRLFAGLFDAFDLDARVDWSVVIDFPHNLYIQELERCRGPVTRYSQFLGGKRFRGKGHFYRALCAVSRYKSERLETVRQAQEGDVDLFHPTYYDDYFLRDLKGLPFVLTVYDMIHEMFPECLNDPVTVDRKKRLIHGARRIIAISHSTKNDLIRLTGVNENKIDVVHLANFITSKPGLAKCFDVPERYILFVGGRVGYKNFRRMFQAAARLMHHDRELYLVCVGGAQGNGWFPAEEARLIASEDLIDRVLIRSATDSDLLRWYQCAQCLVFPSLYEGFGLPILEAFDNHCPVAASSISAMLEVGGDCAVYFDPESVESIAECMERLLNSRELRGHLRLVAKERAAQFSVRRMVKETVDVYEAALFEHR